MKLEYVVIVTDRNGVFNCILDCGIVESLEAANEAIRESKEEDARRGWQYEYRPATVTRANGLRVVDGGDTGEIEGDGEIKSCC